ncbi:hypothetical protein ACFSHQ_04310 [Gemmobacter lanyuensis]
MRLVRHVLGWQGQIGLARSGYWPAVLGLFAFTWFQLVSLHPDDPLTLAQVISAYWLVIFLLGVAEGEDWVRQGEFLTVYLTFLSRIAPIWRRDQGGRVTLCAGLPGRRSWRCRPAPFGHRLSDAGPCGADLRRADRDVFLDVADRGKPAGIHRTLRRAGVNTLGLLAAWALTAGSILGALALGKRMGRVAGPFWTLAGPAMLAFLAIAAGYHAAHYLMTLLTAGQYALAALNDPFFRGDALLGLEPFYISMGFLTDRGFMTALWNTQFALILGAHLLALLLALRLSAQDAPVSARPMAHLPMTVLMIGYTVLGLWILSSPRSVK